MPQPTREHSNPKTASDRAAIERWESEGGRIFAVDDRRGARARVRPDSEDAQGPSAASRRVVSQHEEETRAPAP